MPRRLCYEQAASAPWAGVFLRLLPSRFASPAALKIEPRTLVSGRTLTLGGSVFIVCGAAKSMWPDRMLKPAIIAPGLRDSLGQPVTIFEFRNITKIHCKGLSDIVKGVADEKA